MSAPSDCQIVESAFPSVDFGSDCCTFKANDFAHVTCSNGRVTELSLWYMNLSGSLPSSLFGLTSLTKLVLNNNRFTGLFPSDVSKLTGLTELRIANNPSMSGTIPDVFSSLPKLTILDLGFCSYGGALPPSIGSPAGLTTIYLHGNLFYGSIPSSLGNLASLSLFWINGTCIDTTSIPAWTSKVADFVSSPSAGAQCDTISASLNAEPKTSTSGNTDTTGSSTASLPTSIAGGGSSTSALSVSLIGTGSPANSGSSGNGAGSVGPTGSANPSSTETTSAFSSTAVVATVASVGSAIVIALVVIAVILVRRNRTGDASRSLKLAAVDVSDAAAGGDNQNGGPGGSNATTLSPSPPEMNLPPSPPVQPSPPLTPPSRDSSRKTYHGNERTHTPRAFTIVQLAPTQTNKDVAEQKRDDVAGSRGSSSGLGTNLPLSVPTSTIASPGVQTLAELPAYAEVDGVFRTDTGREGVV
ncbi:hypothetical protein DFJ73DRAFT_866848 [Zopfochytrium polystomum]|nr:hypothetical protein DFJ73DRAFT_866848 [Zopfochytrium polystomum]